MDSAALQWIALLVLALPMSMASWTFGILSAGYLREPSEQPVYFRVFSRRMPKPPGGSPYPPGIFFAAVGVVFFNAAPVAILIRNPYGAQALVADLAYLLVQLVWLGMTLRAGARAR
jgi:hypothetical protein